MINKYTSSPYTWPAWSGLQGMRMLTALAGGNSRRGGPGGENYKYNDVRIVIMIVIMLKRMMPYGYINKICLFERKELRIK